MDTVEAQSFWAGLRVKARCIYALMLREMMLRYGRNNLGFLWVFLEPMLLCIGVMVISAVARKGTDGGVSVLALVITGYMPLTLWRHLTTSCVMLYRRSINVLYHRHITLYDIFAAKMLLEFTGASAAFIVIYMTLLSVNMVSPIHDPGLMVAGWLMLALYALSVGYLIAALSEYYEIFEKLIHPFQYLVVPLSGAFFLVDWLPLSLQKIIWFNPTTHGFEMFRAGYFGDVITTYYTPWYPIGLSMINLVIGYRITEAARRDLHL